MASLRDRYNIMVGERNTIREIQSDLVTQRDTLAGREEHYSSAVSVLEAMSDSFRETIVSQVTGLLTSAVEDIFGEGSGCRLYYRQLPAGQYQPEFEAWDTQGVTGNPMDVFGGSAVEIIALSLRIFFIVRSGQPRILAIDEPLRGIDSVNVHAVGRWLRAVSEQLEIQLIMVSHVGEGVFEDVAHKTLLVEKEGGVSSIKEVTDSG